jgi:hypothetical protein
LIQASSFAWILKFDINHVSFVVMSDCHGVGHVLWVRRVKPSPQLVTRMEASCLVKRGVSMHDGCGHQRMSKIDICPTAKWQNHLQIRKTHEEPVFSRKHTTKLNTLAGTATKSRNSLFTRLAQDRRFDHDRPHNQPFKIHTSNTHAFPLLLSVANFSNPKPETNRKCDRCLQQC